MLAKHPNLMAEKTIWNQTYKMDGDILRVTWKSDDGSTWIFKYKRLE
jgi:hypothetical protein